MLEAFPSMQRHSELFATALGAPGLLRRVQSNSLESSRGTPGAERVFCTLEPFGAAYRGWEEVEGSLEGCGAA